VCWNECTKDSECLTYSDALFIRSHSLFIRRPNDGFLQSSLPSFNQSCQAHSNIHPSTRSQTVCDRYLFWTPSGWERPLSGCSGTEMQVGVAFSRTFLLKVPELPDHLNRLRRPPKWWMSYGSTRNSTTPLPKNTRKVCMRGSVRPSS